MDFWFVRVTEEHLPLLHEWLNRPHIAEVWHGPHSLEQVVEDFGPDSGTNAFIAMQGDTAIGYIQFYVATECGDGWWEDIKDPGVFGIDYFIADEHRLGKGIGSAMIRTFTQWLLGNQRVTCVMADPAPNNTASIRALEKAGFKKVGPIKTPDGNAILMECRRG